MNMHVTLTEVNKDELKEAMHQCNIDRNFTDDFNCISRDVDILLSRMAELFSFSDINLSDITASVIADAYRELASNFSSAQSLCDVYHTYSKIAGELVKIIETKDLSSKETKIALVGRGDFS